MYSNVSGNMYFDPTVIDTNGSIDPGRPSWEWDIESVPGTPVVIDRGELYGIEIPTIP